MGSSASKEDENTNSNTKHSEELGDNCASKTDSSADDGKETKETNDKIGENIIITKHSEDLEDNGAIGTNSSVDDGKEKKETNGKLGEKCKNFDPVKITQGNTKTHNETQSKTEGNYFRNLYIKNFGDDLDSCELRKMFQKFGFISSAVVQTDEAGRSKGFGFVCFESCASARLAVNEMNGIELNGRKLYVGEFMTKSQRKQLVNKIERMKHLARSFEGTNVYVKNLNETIDDEILKNLFQPFGTITSAKVMRDENGKSKEFGFVNFSKPEEATKAISKRNGFEFKGKVLYATLAQNKEERAWILEERRIQKVIEKQNRKKEMQNKRKEMRNKKEMQNIGVSQKQRPLQIPDSQISDNRVVIGQTAAQPAGMHLQMPPYLPCPNIMIPPPPIPMRMNIPGPPPIPMRMTMPGPPPIPLRMTLPGHPPMLIKDNVHIPQQQWPAEYAAKVMTLAQGCGQNYLQNMNHSTDPTRDGDSKRNTESVTSEIRSSCEREYNMSGAENPKGHQDQTVREEKQKEKRESRRERKKAAKLHAVENRKDQMKSVDFRSSTKHKEGSKSLNCPDTKNVESCKRQYTLSSQRKQVPTFLQVGSDDENNILEMTETNSLSSVESEDFRTRNKTIPDELFESTSSGDSDFDVKSAFICGENFTIESSSDVKCTGKKVTFNLDNPGHLNKVSEKSNGKNLNDPNILLRIADKKKDIKLSVAARLAAIKT